MMNPGEPPPVAPGGAPASSPSLAPPQPSLGNSPSQGSALGGSPVGLEGGSPEQMLAKAQLLLKSGAISPQQYAMILAKLGMGGGPQGAKPPAIAPTGMPAQQPGSQSGQPMAPSPLWNQ